MRTYMKAHGTTCPNRRKLFVALLMISGLALGFSGCSTANHGATTTAHTAHAQYATLELNEGKKWVVAKPMMAHMLNLERAVRGFDRNPGRDHAALATEIQDNLGRLVTSCTMEGKPHDELHKWLMPFLGLSADYSKTTDPQVQQQKLQEIKQALLVFYEYFE